MSEDEEVGILHGVGHPRYEQPNRRCPSCFRPLSNLSRTCEACRHGVYRTLDELRREYNRRNPNDKLSYEQVRSITTALTQKLRHRAANPEFNQGEGALLNEMWEEIQ